MTDAESQIETETIRRRIETGKVVANGNDSPGPRALTWWERYLQSMIEANISLTATRVIDLDAAYIVNHGIRPLTSDSDPHGRWPATRLRRGLAMGSVQSGKTASMIAVVAKALDRGVDIVVVLGGTRLALWRQTFGRLSSQLDNWTDESDTGRRRDRILIPNPRLMSGDIELPSLEDLYYTTPSLVRRMLLERKPMIAVVMKQADHLMQFAHFLSAVLGKTIEQTDRPIQMLVVDDEADDGSILDRDVELAAGDDYEALKQIPRHVARLWAASGPAYETLHSRFYTTYLAYTATPQANFLQSDHNPLSPSDFVTALRVPFDEGSIDPPRSTTFLEPKGLPSYYTGGEVFYRRLAGEPASLCVSAPFPKREDFEDEGKFGESIAQRRQQLLSDALRAYFVSGAIRMLLSEKRLSDARATRASTAKSVMDACPAPHTMLYHPSARVDEHFVGAREVGDWTLAFLPEVERATRQLGRPATVVPQLDVTGLAARLAAEEPLWKAWMRRFMATQDQLSFLPGGTRQYAGQTIEWERVKEALTVEVFPNVRLAVINSDPLATDRPRFEPQRQDDGQFACPTDLYTIFVSGNVMARGLTLEGLCTTLFLRTANEPLADTQMQMQRWFGYRGSYLSWCRVFMFEDQLHLFRGYHEADEALRREILVEMNRDSNDAPAPLVLQGSNFKATGKVTNLRSLPLCPAADPFVRVVEAGQYVTHNAAVLDKLVSTERWSEVVAGERVRGLSMRRQLSLLAVAEILESFKYAHHAPDPGSELHDRWRSIALELALESPEAPLFRPPALGFFSDWVAPPNCPYSIAAYLRLWNAMLTRRARGFYPTDNPQLPWSMIDMKDYAASAPQFYVGIRFGAAGPSTYRFADDRITAMTRDNDGKVLRSTWGSRNPGDGPGSYLGDQLFDYHVHGTPPPEMIPGEPLWRPRGAPGQLLFHVIQTPSGDDAVTVGLALPKGGPDHIAALRASGGSTKDSDRHACL